MATSHNFSGHVESKAFISFTAGYFEVEFTWFPLIANITYWVNNNVKFEKYSSHTLSTRNSISRRIFINPLKAFHYWYRIIAGGCVIKCMWWSFHILQLPQETCVFTVQQGFGKAGTHETSGRKNNIQFISCYIRMSNHSFPLLQWTSEDCLARQ